MSIKAAFKGGLELKFFVDGEFESLEGVDPSKHAPIVARNAVRFLMMGWSDSWTQLLTSSVAHAVFVERNHELLREMRLAFQQGFYQLFDQLKGKELNAEQREQVQLYLSNCLTLLPYGDLTPYESIKVPQYVDGSWEMVEYQVTPIELTQTSGWTSWRSLFDSSFWHSLFIKDYDRVYAYGLEPFFHKNAESHLIFMGTTYPAGQGFLSQINTDLKGFETVGKSLYRTGRDRIQQWLSQQKNSTHVCGVSLGGSLSLLLAIDKGNYKLSRVDALNPAGLHDAWRKSQYDHWDDLAVQPQVIVQKQSDDPVSAFGIWKNDWDILHVVPPKDKKGPNSFTDHFLNYAGFADTTFSPIEAEHDNSNTKRKALNIVLYSFGRGLVFYGALVPYTYVVRPVLSFIMQNRVLMGCVLGVALAASFVFSGILTLFSFLAIAGGLLTSGLVFSLCYPGKNQNNSLQSERAKQEGVAELHDPSLDRNPEMDIYNEENAVDIELTKKEIRTYYQAMRCMVKGKSFVPTEEKESKHIKGVSKKALLEESQDSSDDDVVPFTVTKAKAAHIKHTLTLIEQLGVDNKEELKSALDRNYKMYRLGK